MDLFNKPAGSHFLKNFLLLFCPLLPTPPTLLHIFGPKGQKYTDGTVVTASILMTEFSRASHHGKMSTASTLMTEFSRASYRGKASTAPTLIIESKSQSSGKALHTDLDAETTELSSWKALTPTLIQRRLSSVILEGAPTDLDAETNELKS